MTTTASAPIRARSPRGRVFGAALAAAALLVAGCGTVDEPDYDVATSAVVDLLDRLPAETSYVAAVDAAGMHEALGIDGDDLRTAEPPPLLDDEGGFDPVARALSVLRVSAVPALLSPLTETFGSLDLGAIDAGVYAFEVGDGGFAALVATSHPVDELEQMLEEDGFQVEGDGRWVFPEDDAPTSDDDGELGPPVSPTGGFPAVTVEPGLLVMASSTSTLDAIAAADGAGSAVRSVVEAAGASWGIAVNALEPDADPTVCQPGTQALAIEGEQVHAFVLGGGEDVYTPAEDHPFTVEDPTVVGDTTRYLVTPRSDGPAEEVVFNTLLDSSPFATC
jgi:hypothetical protein